MSSVPVSTAKEDRPVVTPGAPRPLNPASVSLMLLTAALWGGTVVAVKYSEDALPPIAVAAVRFSLAAAFVCGWSRLAGRPLRLATGQTSLALIAGVLLFVQISLFNLAAFWSSASHGILLIATFVIWVALIEHFITRSDSLTRRKLCGLALATTGVVFTLLSVDQPNTPSSVPAATDSATLAGDLIMLLSAMVLSVKVVFIKHAVRHVEPAKLIFWHHVTGALLFSIFTAVVEDNSGFTWQSLTAPVMLGLLYQGLLVGGLCFVIQASLLRYHSATQVAVFGFATPLFGVVAAVVLRGDPFSLWLVASGCCVAVGIYLVNSGVGRGGSGHRES